MVIKVQKNSQNLVPVYLRVWYDYANFTKATGNWVRLHDWDKTQMKVRGSTLEVDTINTQLEGNEASQISLMRLYPEQIKEMERLKGKSYAPATMIKYKYTVLRLNQFVKYKYKRNDIFLYELNYHLINEFDAFLRYKFDNSTTTRKEHVHQVKNHVEKTNNLTTSGRFWLTK